MSAVLPTPLPGTVRDPLYPDSDGREMGESDAHTFAVIHLREGLEDFFAQVLDAYVASQLLFYYERGNPQGRRDPDIMVARGVRGRHRRRSFRLWEEGVLPCTLFEMASENTWREDIGPKRELYERLRIREYFLFDPEGQWLNPVFQGFRLRRTRYAPLTPDAEGCLESRELGLRMRPEGAMLRLIDVRTGVAVLTRHEQIAAERQRAEAEQRRVTALEAEVARLRQQLGHQPPRP
jgi:hypothetical protein